MIHVVQRTREKGSRCGSSCILHASPPPSRTPRAPFPFFQPVAVADVPLMVCCPSETRTRVYDTWSPRYAGIAQCAANRGASPLWRRSGARVAGVTGHIFRPGRLILASRSAGFQWFGRCSPVGFVSRFARLASCRRLVPGSFPVALPSFYQLTGRLVATDFESSASFVTERRSDRNNCSSAGNSAIYNNLQRSVAHRLNKVLGFRRQHSTRPIFS